jgi:hypothetical protein
MVNSNYKPSVGSLYKMLGLDYNPVRRIPRLCCIHKLPEDSLLLMRLLKFFFRLLCPLLCQSIRHIIAGQTYDITYIIFVAPAHQPPLKSA